jgi:hypothetical protein
LRGPLNPPPLSKDVVAEYVEKIQELVQDEVVDDPPLGLHSHVEEEVPQYGPVLHRPHLDQLELYGAVSRHQRPLRGAGSPELPFSTSRVSPAA